MIQFMCKRVVVSFLRVGLFIVLPRTLKCNQNVLQEQLLPKIQAKVSNIPWIIQSDGDLWHEAKHDEDIQRLEHLDFGCEARKLRDS